MGVKGAPDEQILHLMDEAESLVRSNVEPRYVYREAELRFEPDGVYAEGMAVPLTGNDIKKHLNGCTKAVILAATLTPEADKLIRQAGVKGVAESLAVDCICSAAIEQVCDRAEEEIFAGTDPAYRTWRFSPGYGDLPLSLQRDVLLYLNAARRIGLTLTDSSLMIPSKSVTAIIGVSDTAVEKGPGGCANCRMRDHCAFSEKGGCGKRKGN